jgi:hypothetical protein
MRFRDAVILSLRNEPDLLKALPDLKYIVDELSTCEDPDIINVVSLRLWSLVNTYGLVDFMTPDLKFLSQALNEIDIIYKLNGVAEQIVEYYSELRVSQLSVKPLVQFGEPSFEKAKDGLVMQAAPAAYLKNAVEDVFELDRSFARYAERNNDEALSPGSAPAESKEEQGGDAEIEGGVGRVIDSVNNREEKTEEKTENLGGARPQQDQRVNTVCNCNRPFVVVVAALLVLGVLCSPYVFTSKRIVIVDPKPPDSDPITIEEAYKKIIKESEERKLREIEQIKKEFEERERREIEKIKGESEERERLEELEREERKRLEELERRKVKVQRRIGRDQKKRPEPPSVVRLLRPPHKRELLRTERDQNWDPKPPGVIRLPQFPFPAAVDFSRTIAPPPPPDNRMLQSDDFFHVEYKTEGNTIVSTYLHLNTKETYDIVVNTTGSTDYTHLKTGPNVWFANISTILDMALSVHLKFSNMTENSVISVNHRGAMQLKYVDKDGNTKPINFRYHNPEFQQKDNPRRLRGAKTESPSSTPFTVSTLDLSREDEMYFTVEGNGVQLYNVPEWPSDTVLPEVLFNPQIEDEKQYRKLWSSSNIYRFVKESFPSVTSAVETLFKIIAVPPPKHLTSFVCPEDKVWTKIGEGDTALKPCDMIRDAFIDSSAFSTEMYRRNYHEVILNGKLRSVFTVETCTDSVRDGTTCSIDIRIMPEEFPVCVRTDKVNCAKYVYDLHGKVFDPETGYEETNPAKVQEFLAKYPERAKSALYLSLEASTGQTIRQLPVRNQRESYVRLTPSNFIVKESALIDGLGKNVYDFVNGAPGVYVPFVANLYTNHPRTRTAGKDKLSNLVLSYSFEIGKEQDLVSSFKEENNLRKSLSKLDLNKFENVCEGVMCYTPVLIVDEPTSNIQSAVLYFQNVFTKEVVSAATKWMFEHSYVDYSESVDIDKNQLVVPAELVAAFLSNNILKDHQRLFDTIIIDGNLDITGFVGERRGIVISQDQQHTQNVFVKEVSPVYNIQNEISFLSMVRDYCEFEKQQFDFYRELTSNGNVFLFESFNIGIQLFNLLKNLSKTHELPLPVNQVYEDFGPFNQFESFKELGMTVMLQDVGITPPVVNASYFNTSTGEYVRLGTIVSDLPENLTRAHRQSFLELLEKKKHFEQIFDVNLDLGEPIYVEDRFYYPRVISAGNYSVSSCMASLINDFKTVDDRVRNMIEVATGINISYK